MASAGGTQTPYCPRQQPRGSLKADRPSSGCSGTGHPLKRLNREVNRRTDVVGIFPNDASLLRLSACVLIEAHDEWQVSDRRYLSEQSMAQLTPPVPTALEARRDTTPEVIDTADVKTALVSTNTEQHANGLRHAAGRGLVHVTLAGTW
jgi:hypothetical protein